MPRTWKSKDRSRLCYLLSEIKSLVREYKNLEYYLIGDFIRPICKIYRNIDTTKNTEKVHDMFHICNITQINGFSKHV